MREALSSCLSCDKQNSLYPFQKNKSTPQIEAKMLYSQEMTSKISIKTFQKREIIDITGKIEVFVPQSKVISGIIQIFALHTTCAIIITEPENGLKKDLFSYLEKESPQGPFSHNHGDSAHVSSHLLSALIGQGQTVLIENGRLFLGSWQRVCLLELDGPKTREIAVKIIKDEKN